ncbi:MAG: translation initiation factor eIF-1A [Candidatus Geothermarchaeales archaeon]
MGKRKVLTEKELRDTPLPSTGQLLGIAKKMLGNDRVMVLCTDRRERSCRIKGKLRRRVWIREGDAVIVELWGFQNEVKGTIVGRYIASQRTWLRENNYLPDWIF